MYGRDKTGSSKKVLRNEKGIQVSFRVPNKMMMIIEMEKYSSGVHMSFRVPNKMMMIMETETFFGWCTHVSVFLTKR